MKKNIKMRKSDIKTVREKLPTHLVNLVAIIKNNSEIRRFTSLAIINYLKQKGIINTDKAFVTFNWTKFTVSVNGLGQDYRYNEQFLIDALCGSFNSFAHNAENIISVFLDTENEKVNSNLPVEEQTQTTNEN